MINISPVAFRNGAIALLAVFVLAIIVIGKSGGGSGGHDIYVTTSKATGALNGQYIRAAGTIVGKVAEVKPMDGGRSARLKLHLDDDVWPLPKGTTFTMRWGGTISIFNRYLLLDRGKDGGAEMVADGGDFPAGGFRVPVEYGDLLKVFDKQLRADTKTFLDTSGVALDAAGKPLNRALDVAPGALAEADAVLSTLDESRGDVEALVQSTGRVVDAIDRADPRIGALIQGAGTTLNAIASDVSGLQATLDRAPGTLKKATSTLKRADGTLAGAQQVTDRLAPGVRQLRRIASPLNSLLGTLVDVGPTARATLATAGAAAPDVTKMVDKLASQAPALESIGKQADLALNCIRPYSPEIASFGTLWGSALSNNDGRDNYIRAIPTVSFPAPTNAQYNNSGEALKAFPGATYAFPRPPGTQAGTPWFLPECGAGPDALDPTKDPEARKFDPISQFSAGVGETNVGENNPGETNGAGE
ncbi:hypothetical protein DSM112329_00365 [Paraconexibacter sp. AEG42_29]|uniref:MCE family protein n=1 Tax=Paraconexibacter sp. AEG42_29 TaxID=2997339 RepID=A0AAU7APH4_9ACTN